MSKKFTIILFPILVLFSTQFGYAINIEPIGFCLKEITSLPEDNSKHEVVLKITNRNSSGAAKIKQIYFAPPSEQHNVTVESTDVSQCRLLNPGKSCQASAVISADQAYVDGSMPISVSYVIDREPSNTNTGCGLAHSSVSWDTSTIRVAGTDILKFTDTSYPKITLKNVSKSPIKITNVSLESGKATLYEMSNSRLSVQDPESSCEVTMMLGWSDWFKLKDMPNNKDYIIVESQTLPTEVGRLNITAESR